MGERSYPWGSGAPWDALDGEAPLSTLADYLRSAERYLSENEPPAINSDQSAARDRVRAHYHLRILLYRLAETLDPDGSSKRQLKLGGRGKGRPPSPAARRNKRAKEHRAVMIVNDLSAECPNDKKEWAVAEATRLTGLSRAEVFHALDREARRLDPESATVMRQRLEVLLEEIKQPIFQDCNHC